ncbi:hypothetical protein J25TS5_13240 [Paenibacillus faecis]|nr:hypothetical protein J25TS5_13240 [Paenibacillus faecis]
MGGFEKRCKSADISSDFRKREPVSPKIAAGFAGILNFLFQTRKKHADMQEFYVSKVVYGSR